MKFLPTRTFTATLIIPILVITTLVTSIPALSFLALSGLSLVPGTALAQSECSSDSQQKIQTYAKTYVQAMADGDIDKAAESLQALTGLLTPECTSKLQELGHVPKLSSDSEIKLPPGLMDLDKLAQ